MAEVKTMKKKSSAREREQWWKENIEVKGYCEEEITAEEWKEMKESKMEKFEESIKKLGLRSDGTRNI